MTVGAANGVANGTVANGVVNGHAKVGKAPTSGLLQVPPERAYMLLWQHVASAFARLLWQGVFVGDQLQAACGASGRASYMMHARQPQSLRSMATVLFQLHDMIWCYRL